MGLFNIKIMETKKYNDLPYQDKIECLVGRIDKLYRSVQEFAVSANATDIAIKKIKKLNNKLKKLKNGN